jgi:diaminopimelate epimerase
LTDKKKILVQTMKTVIEPELLADGRVKVNMGAPIFDLSQLPFAPGALPTRYLGRAKQWKLDHAEGSLWFSALSMGNPTATVFVQNVGTTPVDQWGQFIGEHPIFPNRTNVAFLEVLDKNNARIRVFERGAGETLACGSGTCAAIVAAMNAGLCQDFVEVQAQGGQLRIEWDGLEDSPVYLIGPAEHVFDGELEI